MLDEIQKAIADFNRRADETASYFKKVEKALSGLGMEIWGEEILNQRIIAKSEDYRNPPTAAQHYVLLGYAKIDGDWGIAIWDRTFVHDYNTNIMTKMINQSRVLIHKAERRYRLLAEKHINNLLEKIKKELDGYPSNNPDSGLKEIEMSFFVSRQVYWPDGQHTVEIAVGGLDYANPDMLSRKYDGEGREYTNPHDAVAAAKQVAKRWREDCPEETIHIAAGSTGGFTYPFEPSDDAELLEWAQRQFEKLPRCAQCGEVVDKHAITIDDEVFCREFCAEKYMDADAVDEEGE